jgi:Tol biopolymer transport system component
MIQRRRGDTHLEPEARRRRVRRAAAATVVAAATAVTLAAGPGGPSAGAGQSGSAPARTQVAWSRFVDLDFSAAGIVIRTGDGTTRRITRPPSGVQDVDPAISPDGRWVAFERDYPDGRAALGLVRSDGTGERILHRACTDPCVAALAPTWTPDGTRLAFSRVSGLDLTADDPTAASAVLWLADLDGRHRTRLSQAGIDGRLEDYRASFAPGGYVVFVRIRNSDGHLAVFRMSRTGTHVRRLTPWSLDADVPWVSPAGTGRTEHLVVFETYGHGAPDGTAQAIATVPATCRPASSCRHRIRMLTSAGSLPVQHFNPTFSPNGRRIAYVRFHGFEDAPSEGDIWTMRWDGSDKRALSHSPLFEFRPSWGVTPRRR